MDTLQLSLRQRKLLHTLQKQDSYMTGKELADLLHVSARTIRSDITEINYILAQHNAAILSTHSKGYLFQAKDPEKIKELNRIDTAFFTKEDRIHYLTQQLCLSDEPLNLFDLEDEIFISHTTLMYDLQIIKKRFSMNTPYIQIMLSKNEISFEKNEKKIRQILLSLAHENWDYTNRGNALYKFRFLNWDFIAFVAAKLPDLLCKYNIYMEDPTLVALELSLAIMYHRIQSGHTLPETDAFPMTDTAAYLICKALFSLLETQYHCTFPKSERDTVYLFISSMSIQNHAPAKKENIPFFFGPITIDTANSYLNKINALFQIDFSQDEDFYWTLLLYLRDLQTGHSIFTCQQNLHDFKTSLLGECEFAYIFQEFAPEYMGRRLTETELVNLAFLFSGALSYHLTLHPEKKLKAVLCCHEKLTTTWALKRKLLSRFQNYIDITALLPVHSKTTYDFSNTDLILTTIQKKFANAPMQKIILVDDRPSANFYDLDLPIQLIVMHSICPMPSCSIKQLFEHAYWHE